MASEMAMDLRCGLMVLNTRENGKMIKLMDKAS
jgi:hypothetical protein